MNWFKSLTGGSNPQRRVRAQFPLVRTEHFEPRLCLGRLVTMQSDPTPSVPAEVAGVPGQSSNFAANDNTGSTTSGNGLNGHGITARNNVSFTATESQSSPAPSTSPQGAINTQVSQPVDSQLSSAFDESQSHGAANPATNPAPNTAPIQKNNTDMSASTTGSSSGTIAPATGGKSTPPAATAAPKTPGSAESKIAASGDNVMGAPSKMSSDQLTKLGLQFDADGNAIGINSKVGTYDLWWKDASGPVTVKYDFRSQGGYQNQITDAQKAVAVTALNDWSAATGGKLVFVQDTSAPASEVINIGVGDLQAVGYTGGQSVISLGGGQVTVTPDGKFTDAGIAWLDASQNWSMSSNTPNPASTYDFYTIVAHEVGHAIGFGESVPTLTPDIMTDPYQGPMNAAALAHAVQNDRMYLQAGTGAPTTNFPLMAENGLDSTPTLTSDEVKQLLQRAAGASATQDAIIAVVDRNGRILGVRVEAHVLATISDPATLVYAIDGAVAEARTAAMFSNANPVQGTVAPLTSRTVEEISQSTITQREVQSTPDINIGDPVAQGNSTLYGPGLVAPIGLGGHFPPGIDFTSPVDLFDIEHTNRDVGPTLPNSERFNIDLANVPGGAGGPNVLFAPESYGTAQNSGLLPGAQSRGIGTLPGGIPIMKLVLGPTVTGLPGIVLQGGIGVFFPGKTGDASYEQGFVPGVDQSESDRMNSPLELEAEYMAFAAVGGIIKGRDTPVVGAEIGDIAGIPPLKNVGLPLPAPATFAPNTIFLGGIELPLYGPGPIYSGTQTVVDTGKSLGVGDPNNGVDMPLIGAPDGMHRAGLPVANGWLVAPHDAAPGNGGLTAADVTQIIEQGIDAASRVRAAIRLDLGSTTRMVLAVTDTQGNVLGLYRMEDATTFSIDVAVSKARNVSYYDSSQLKPQDQVVQPGVSFTNRTFRFLAEPRFPAGVENTLPPPFSTLHDPGIDPATAENIAGPLAASNYIGLNASVAGNDAFVPSSNFHQDPNPYQSGIVFFPGSTALYRGGQLIGGLGVSGDGVDQDDTVTFCAAQGFLPTSATLRADQVFFYNADDPDDGVRLPFIEFLRNAFVT